VKTKSKFAGKHPTLMEVTNILFSGTTKTMLLTVVTTELTFLPNLTKMARSVTTTELMLQAPFTTSRSLLRTIAHLLSLNLAE
jgi:hypothetical protein